MDKLAQPKQQPSPGKEATADPTDIDRSAAGRPSLKRRVKSQGDIPEADFPLLPRRRRTGPPPASATVGRPAEERGVAGATRRTLPLGLPRRSAWPLQNDDEGAVTRQNSESLELSLLHI